MMQDKLTLSAELSKVLLDTVSEMADVAAANYDEAFMRGIVFALGEAMNAPADDEVSVLDVLRKARAWLDSASEGQEKKVAVAPILSSVKIADDLSDEEFARRVEKALSAREAG